MDREKALELYNRTAGVWQVERVVKDYWKKAGGEGAEIPLIKQPLRISINDGVIGFTKNWQVERWGEVFGEELQNKIQVLDKWKYGCRAILTAEDTPLVEKVMDRIVEAVKNEKNLKVPSLNDEISEKIIGDYENYHARKNQTKEKELQLKLEAEKIAFEKSNALLNKVTKNVTELQSIGKSFTDSVDSMKKKLAEITQAPRKKLPEMEILNESPKVSLSHGEKEKEPEIKAKIEKKHNDTKMVLNEIDIKFKKDQVYIKGVFYGTKENFQKDIDEGLIEIDWNKQLKHIGKKETVRKYESDLENDEIELGEDLSIEKEDDSFNIEENDQGEDIENERVWDNQYMR